MSVPLTHDAPIDRVLARLKAVKPAGSGKWMAQCPTHVDKTQSLSIRVGNDGRTVMYCHAGCQTADIVQAMDLTMSDLFAGDRPPLTVASSLKTAPAQGVTTRPKLIKTYDYTDADGTLLYQACRLDPKSFRQRRKNAAGEWVWNLEGTALVPYCLPQLIEAVAMERTVFVVEGEKDADALNELGFTATTSPMGAGKWREEYAPHFAKADVVVIPDNDDVGRTHMQQVAASLTNAGATVKVVTLPNIPEKGDFSDWYAAGGSLDDFAELVAKAPRWTVESISGRARTRWRLDEIWENEEMMRPPSPVVPYLAWESRSTLLAAREKSGKSTLTGYVTAAVSRGRDFLGEPCHRGHVLVIGLEEFIGDTARRLRDFGADGSQVTLVDHFALDPADRPSEVRSHIEAVKPVLVILDSLVAYSRGAITDANNATQTQAVVQGLTDLSHSTGAALIIIHHARKADGKYRDSSAIGGAVDIIAEVFPPEECEKTDPTRRRVRPVGRVPARGVDFRFDGDTYSLVDTDGPLKAPLDQRILAVVKDRPGISANDIVTAVGDTRSIVLKRIALLLQNRALLNDGTSHFMKLRTPTYTPSSALL